MAIMEEFDFDIAILGAGPAGCALACTLASVSQGSLRIALFQGISKQHDPAKDTRVLALNHGSQVFLEKHRLWPDHSAPIETVHVSQKNRLGRTLISSKDFNVPMLGSVVAYAQLYRKLQERLQQLPVTMLSGELASATQENGNAPVIVTQGEKTWRTRIAIQCDGIKPKGIHREYNQHALITSARAQFPETRMGLGALHPGRPPGCSAAPHLQGCPIHCLVYLASARAGIGRTGRRHVLPNPDPAFW